MVDVGSSGGGGKVEAGFSDVRAYTRAAAEVSANTLNSATGVMFPVASTAPPIVTTSFTRRNVSGSSAAARAQFVSGPMATMVMVSGSFSRKIRRISWCAGREVGLKEDVGSVRWSVSFAASVMMESGGGCSNSFFHVSSGERCGCWITTLLEWK